MNNPATGRDPILAPDRAEVAETCDLLERAAALLTTEDGCCHQLHQTARWHDSQLIRGWLTDLATGLRQRSNTALYDAQHTPIT